MGYSYQIVVVGDSIAEGLGVKGQSYSDLLPKELTRILKLADPNCISINVRNLAKSAQQISYSLALLPTILASSPDLVIVAHGITEGLLRPTPKAMRFVPPRWRTIGWLDPKPYFSKHPIKAFVQQIESAIRWRYKVLLMRKFGSVRLTSPADYEIQLGRFVDSILQGSNASVLLLTQMQIDPVFYPHAPASFLQYRNAMQKIASTFDRSQRVKVCDLSNTLETWSDFFADRFHPNQRGHQKIAGEVARFFASQLQSNHLCEISAIATT